MSADGTDVEVLTRGFRSRLGLLGLLVLGGLGAALWTGTRDSGTGAAEDRRKLMVATQDDGAGVDYYAVLERGGFVIEVDSFDDWQAVARARLPESEAEGVALVLELADDRGFGFVVFEAPGQLELGGLELEPSVDEIEDFGARDYAALSVGDLAFPHHLSVDEPGEDEVVRVPGYGAIQAVFAQPALTAREDVERPTIEELQHEDAIRIGRQMYQGPSNFVLTIERARASIDATLAQDPRARTLVAPLVTGSAVPTPDGGVLVVHHELDVYSEDARTLRLRGAETMRLDYLSPAAVERLLEGGELELSECPTLAGGSIQMERRPRLEAAVDGSALVVATAGDDARIWRKTEAPGCEWRELALVPAVGGSPGLPAPRLMPAAGREGQRMLLAQAGADGEGGATVRVWLEPEPEPEPEPDAEPEPGVVSIHERGQNDGPLALDLLRLSEGSVSALAFVDDLHLAALSRTPLRPEQQAEHAILVLDRRRPGARLAIPSALFAEGRALNELALVSPALARDSDVTIDSDGDGEDSASRFELGPRFVVSVTDVAGPTELFVISVSAEPWQAFEDAVLATGELEPGALTLSRDELRVERVDTQGARVSALVVSTGAGALAYAGSQGSLPSEIHDLSLTDAALGRLTDNTVVDSLPRFTADGRHLVYATMMRSSLSTVPFSVPRIVSRTTPQASLE